jgi:hypothetical protein
MRVHAQLKALGTAAAMALFLGCSVNSTSAPKLPILTQSQGPRTSLIESGPNPFGVLKLQFTHRQFSSFNNCPKTGTIEYVSDYENGVIEIFSGNWHDQAPCGMLTVANGVNHPEGVSVHKGDLYVANSSSSDVIAFHRGGTTPFKTYVDYTGNVNWDPQDVTVAPDKTIIATNFRNYDNATGSISTWHPGGHLVGHFPSVAFGVQNYYLTVQRNGNVYYDDSTGTVYVGSCPLGACGAFTPTGVILSFPGGIRSLGTAPNFDTALLVDDSGAKTLDTFTSFPTPTTCGIPGATYPIYFDINHANNHVYVVDATANIGIEMTYPGCVLIGVVHGGMYGQPGGVAIDRPGALD